MNPTAFTLNGYTILVEGLLKRGYETRSFHDFNAGKPHLLLRHDMDQSISIARTLADLEASHGWRSTWFVLVRTEMYNPFSRASSENLKAILAAGHEIGLHLDPTYYENDDSLNKGASIECQMLEDILGTRIRIISFHRPQKSLIGNDQLFAGRQHTYMSQFVKSIGYSSDSRGEWKFGHPWDHEAVTNRTALQLLTHAIWWVGHEEQGPLERLTYLLKTKAEELDRELEMNSSVWQNKQDSQANSR